jgi:hypothetical protein
MGERIVHCARDPYDVYIGRGRECLYGNPWEIGPDGTREEVIERYETWLRHGDTFGHPMATEARRRAILDSLWQLRGKSLGCWCAPERCHGEVLVTLLAEQDQEKAAQG